MTLRNNPRERGVDAPRRLTAEEQAAVEARRPLRYAAARNVVRAVQLSYPEVFEPAPQATQVAAPAMSNVVSLEDYRMQGQPEQPQVQPTDESQAELARQAIANIFNPGQDMTDVKEAA